MEIILQKTQSVDWGKGNMVCESILWPRLSLAPASRRSSSTECATFTFGVRSFLTLTLSGISLSCGCEAATTWGTWADSAGWLSADAAGLFEGFSLIGCSWWGLCGPGRAGGRLGRVGAAGGSRDLLAGVWGRVGLLGSTGTAVIDCFSSVINKSHLNGIFSAYKKSHYRTSYD